MLLLFIATSHLLLLQDCLTLLNSSEYSVYHFGFRSAVDMYVASVHPTTGSDWSCIMVRDKGCHVLLYGCIYILWMRAFLNLFLYLLCIKQMLIVVACKGPSFRLMSFVDFYQQVMHEKCRPELQFQFLEEEGQLVQKCLLNTLLPD